MPKSPAPTIDDVLAKYSAARQKLMDLRKQLSDQEKAITDGYIAEGRQMPNLAEHRRLHTIWTGQDQVDAACHELPWDKLITIDKSDAVTEIAQNFDDVKKRLDGTLITLKKIKEFADLIAQLAELLSQIGQSLLSLGLPKP